MRQTFSKVSPDGSVCWNVARRFSESKLVVSDFEVGEYEDRSEWPSNSELMFPLFCWYRFDSSVLVTKAIGSFEKDTSGVGLRIVCLSNVSGSVNNSSSLSSSSSCVSGMLFVDSKYSSICFALLK